MNELKQTSLSEILQDFYLKKAEEQRKIKEAARISGNYEEFNKARIECNNYVKNFPKELKEKFWED